MDTVVDRSCSGALDAVTEAPFSRDPTHEAMLRQSALFARCARALADAGIPFCVLHDHEELADAIRSDIDCIVPKASLPSNLPRALARAGLLVVQHLQHEATAHYFVVTDQDRTAPPCYVKLDVSSDYRRDGRVFYDGKDFLERSQSYDSFLIPDPSLAFGCYLVKRIMKGVVEPCHGARLSALYQQDPYGAATEVRRFWSGSAADELQQAAARNDWSGIGQRIDSYRREARRNVLSGHLLGVAAYHARDLLRRVDRVCRPTGLHVVFLGADGSGKSTVMEAVEQQMAPAFRRTVRRHLAPGFRRRTSSANATDPHGQAPRTVAQSLLKAGFWLLDYTLGYAVMVRPALVRSTLVLFDRYYSDALIDPRRYRYGGPTWVLRAISRVLPKPDLVILLDAPAEVLQSRKQEVPLIESARQRRGYLGLIRTMRNGRVIDAAQPADQVIAATTAVIIERLVARTGRRLGLDGNP